MYHTYHYISDSKKQQHGQQCAGGSWSCTTLFVLLFMMGADILFAFTEKSTVAMFVLWKLFTENIKLQGLAVKLAIVVM